MHPTIDTIFFEKNRHDPVNCSTSDCTRMNKCIPCRFAIADMHRYQVCLSCSNDGIGRRLGRYGNIAAVQSIMFDTTKPLKPGVNVRCHCYVDIDHEAAMNVYQFVRAFPNLKRIVMALEKDVHNPRPYFEYLDLELHLFRYYFQLLLQTNQMTRVVRPDIVACRRPQAGVNMGFLQSYHRFLLQNQEIVTATSAEFKYTAYGKGFHRALAGKIGFGGQPTHIVIRRPGG